MTTYTQAALVGTWKLVSRIDTGLDGKRRIDPVLDADPVAILMYDASGHFAVQFMRRDRDFASQNSAASPINSNNSNAVNGYDAYFGRYSVGDDGTVTQELLGALSPGDVGKVVTRSFRIDGDGLVIELKTAASDGYPISRTLRWKRVA